MATKLKNLVVRKVDFVDEGANPDAHIRMLKRKEKDADGASRRESGNILKKMFGFIGKVAGMNQEEIDSVVDEIQKGDSVSFSEKINEVRNYKIADEMWDTCYALQSALCSILNDEEVDSDGAAKAMKESLDEFYKVVQESIKEWSGGKSADIVMKTEEVSEADLKIMKSAVKRLEETIEKACTNAAFGEIQEIKPEKNEEPKGDRKGMEIDKSKLTDAERAFLESIEKRCGMDEGTGTGAAPEPAELPQIPAEPPVAKGVKENAVERPAQTDEHDDIYKGLHPAVKAELEELKKYREESENEQLANVAKKYAIIGRKEEELVPMFKSLKRAGGTAYEDMIAVLDSAVATVEKSGAFSEVGRSGHGSTGTAEAKIDTIAKKYQEQDPSLDYSMAVAKAWENHPEIMDEYEKEEGF